MRNKLLKTYLLIIFITIFVTLLFSWGKTKDYFFDRVKNEAIIKTTLLHDILKTQKHDKASMQKFVVDFAAETGNRITIIDKKGNVIAESDNNPDEMDNHKNREEVSKVLKEGGIYNSLRYSDTMGLYYQYVAKEILFDDFQGVLRIAAPIKEKDTFLRDVVSVIFNGLFVGILIALVIAYFITRKMMVPISELTLAANKISEGNYEDKIYVQEKDEIGTLANAFNNMAYKLNINMWNLEQRNSELESILKSMSNGIITVTPDLKIGTFNDVFRKLFHIEEQDIKGKLFYEVTRNLIVFELLEKSLELGEMIVKEARIEADNQEKYYLIYANPIRSIEDNKKILGAILVVQDVTQLRKLESMRSDFVSNVTHELKTPLTSIRGFVDTLKNGAIEDEEVALRFLDIIDIEAERLEGLIHDILVLSEIETMVGESNIGSYQLEEIANEVADILRPEADKKSIVLTVESKENLEAFKCNKNRIKQLLINLIANAIKYTDSGFVKVSLKEEFKFAVIEIEDSGIGIDKKHIPRLFERFYRVDKGRSRETGGTGLGLSIVKHIVELYNGRIQVESKLGEGTKISIRLPY